MIDMSVILGSLQLELVLNIMLFKVLFKTRNSTIVNAMLDIAEELMNIGLGGAGYPMFVVPIALQGKRKRRVTRFV